MNTVAVRVDELTNGVVHVVLQAPQRRNPIDHHVLDALEEAMFAGAGAVVLSAAPGPAFSAGGDLSLEPRELDRVSSRIYSLCTRLAETATVLVAAANGDAVGGGAHLFLTADLRVAGPELRFRPALPDRSLAAGAWLLPAMVGRGRALDLLLTGRALDAAEALAWGVADRVADHATEAALELAGNLASTPERHRARVKRTVSEPRPLSALAYEQATFTAPQPPADRMA